MPVLKNYKIVDDYRLLPTEGTYIVLTRSQSFLARAIQGFQRLFQWTKGEKETELSPNHADIVRDGYAIGALKFGVDGNDFQDHYADDKKAVYYVIRPMMTKRQEAKLWGFMKAQVHERYAYLDLLKYAFNSLLHKWFGRPEPLDRKKWTCYSLVASALNYGWDEEMFPDPYKISPIEVVDIIDFYHDIKFV